MQAQELLRKAADIYAQSGKEAYAPMALAKAAGMAPADTDYLDLTWDPQKPTVRRAEHFFCGIANFLDQCEAEGDAPCEDVQDGVPSEDELAYSRAVEKIAQDRCCAIMQLEVVKAYMSESAESCSERYESFYKAYLYDHEYKAELKLVAFAFDKSLEEVHADILKNPLSIIYSGFYDDEY